jgi:hypothetical protein
MTDTDREDYISDEVKKAIKDEAFAQAAKWAIGVLVSLIGFAAVGWWLFLKPILIEVFGGVPSNSVVAFDLRDKCPSGWSPFNDANGRFIVGAGKGEGLTVRSFAQTGGNETHALTIRQMPAHTHPYIDWAGGPGSCTFSGCNGTGGDQKKTTSPAGGTENGTTEPFELLPPFLALRMCKKD